MKPNWGNKGRKKNPKPLTTLGLAAYYPDDPIAVVVELAERTNTAKSEVARWLFALGLEVAAERGLLPEGE